MAQRQYNIYGIAAIFAAIVIALLLLEHERAMVLSDVRAYVAGEGFYAKAQKRAVIQLYRYARSRSEADYQGFLDELAVPIGDRDARLALLRASPDIVIASEGFLRGRNHPQEVDRMGRFFIYFQDISYVAEAIRIWTEADREVARLQALGGMLRGAVAAGADPAAIERLLDDVAMTDNHLTVLEDQFSQSLGDGARFMVLVTEILIFSVAILMLGLGWVFSMRVVRNVRHADAAVRQSEARYRALNESMVDGLLITQNGHFVHANPAGLALTGYTMEELMGQEFVPLIHPDFRDLVLARHRQRSVGDGAPQRYDIRVLRRDGDTFWAQLSNARVDWNGQPAVLTIITNIQERKDAEDQIRHLNDSLENRVQERTADLKVALEEMESYSYSISHDLRAPLRAVNSYAEILRQEHARELGEDGRELLARVAGNAHFMAQLVDALLEFARLGRSPLDRATVDMDTLARAVAGDLGAMSAVHIAAPLPAVQGDLLLLRQVWTNLLSNALKFSAGAAAPRIEISATNTGSELVYQVQDNGIGFDMAYAPKLFGVFQRLHGPDQYPGVGIGLALVKRIVERHGGRVLADGAPGGGATFSFTLPDAA